MSIVLEALTKHFGETKVVREVELRVGTGELFVLLGPSGSGKSTLLRMIAGLEEPDGGRVLLHGRDVTRVPPRERGVGFVFQHYALFRHMTVAENVEFPLRVRNVGRRERARRREELLELVGLSGFSRRRPAQLSGGQQQRVALARALAASPPLDPPKGTHSPPVLLLDEPFGALDARIRVELRHTIRRIQRELAVTTVFVTHDQEEAFALADRIGILEAGRLLEVGSPADLYLRPRSDFVATFLGAGNVLVGEAGRRSVRLGPVELPLAPESEAAEGGRVRVLFRPEDVELAAGPTLSPALGRGIVEEAVFAGSFERVRIRLPAPPGVRAVAPGGPFGADYLWADALRPQPESQRLPLAPGDEVTVGLRRVHVLAPGRLRLLHLPAGNGHDPGGDLAVALASRLGAELLSRRNGPGPGDAEGDADLGILTLGGDGSVLERELPGPDVRHLLLVRGPAPVPARLLVCVAVGEPGKVDVSFAERLAWKLGARVTLLTVLPPSRSDGTPEHVARFHEAATRVLSRRGVEVTSRLRRGSVRREILAELREGEHDLLVVGAPLPEPAEPPRMEGVVRELLDSAPGCPVLVIRAPRELPGLETVPVERSRP